MGLTRIRRKIVRLTSNSYVNGHCLAQGPSLEFLGVPRARIFDDLVLNPFVGDQSLEFLVVPRARIFDDLILNPFVGDQS